jgi:hypothetical protein
MRMLVARRSTLAVGVSVFASNLMRALIFCSGSPEVVGDVAAVGTDAAGDADAEADADVAAEAGAAGLTGTSTPTR